MTNDEIADELLEIFDGLIPTSQHDSPSCIRLHELTLRMRGNPSRESRAAVGLDFATALATGLPMRRAKWMMTGPMASGDNELIRIAAAAWWIYPVPLRKTGEPLLSAWINLANAERMVLTRDDYTATDWEVIQ